MALNNLWTVEANLQDIQDTIQGDENIFRNWNMKKENKRAKVRNEAANMILKTKSLSGIKSLERPKIKKVRYVFNPNSNM